MRTIIRTLVLLFAVVCASHAQRPGGFRVIGPGGGGAMFIPTISPHDPNTVLLACDMTGGYITHDAGKTWRMFNLRGEIRFFAFDPVDSKIIYAGTTALWRSVDDGDTWNLVYPAPAAIQSVQMNSDHADEKIIARPDPVGAIVALAVDPDDHRVLYAAGGYDRNLVLFVSSDFGGTWRKLDSVPEEPLKIWIDPRSPRAARRLIIASSHFITVRKLKIHTYPAPAELFDVSIGFGSGEEPTIYATSDKGLFLTNDAGKNWQGVDLPGNGAQVRAIGTSLHHPETAYVSYSHLKDPGSNLLWMGVAKTNDFGKTWHLVWKESDKPAANVHDAWISERFGPGWGENPLALGVAEQDSNLCYGTDLGRTMRTTDGGATWDAVYSRRVPGGGWTSTGLDVTTSYGVHFDPFDGKTMFITYTDIGLFRSQDSGNTWQSSTTGVPEDWVNTTYWIQFDPKVPGRIWSVNSGTHDLPRPKMWRHQSVLNYKGGVCRSDDGGKNWVESSTGMGEAAPTHILLDPASPVNARTLYVAALGKGVYKSTDDGRTWALQNRGISQAQPLAWRLARDSEGTLYVILARRSEDGSIGNDDDGAIYRSRDGAENWERVPLPHGVNGPNGMAIDPRDGKRIYLAAWAKATGTHGDGGGAFLSEDAGKTWRPVLDRDRHVYDVTIDQRNPDRLYAAGFESSAWCSLDRGEHWTRIPGFNFKMAHRVIPDPVDQESVYVTTFGGSAWHGSTDGGPAVLDLDSPSLGNKEIDLGHPK